VSSATTRRTIAAVVTVWVLGLLLVLGLWQRVEAACGDEPMSSVPAECTAADGGNAAARSS
jgi:CHASE2 domain-containing sensor protein